MRSARPTPAAGPGRARRAAAVVALGALALAGAAPVVAASAAAAQPTPTPDATAPAVGTVPLPAEDQADQVPAVPEVGAADDEPTPGPSPTDAPTDAPTAGPAPSPSASDAPTCPEVVTGCFGTGKAYAEVTSQDGAPLAGALLELDVTGTDPAPEWTGTTDEAGDVPGWYDLPAGATATVRVVSAPAGSMVVGATSQKIGPCVVATEGAPADCDLTTSFELTRAYRVLDVVVADDAGAPLAGATFELWGAAPAAEPPAEPEPSPTEDPTRDDDDDRDDDDHDDDRDDDDRDDDDREGKGHDGPGRGHDHHADDDVPAAAGVRATGDVRALAAPVPAGRVLVATATSDATGRLSFGRVTPGTYELRATAVPAGYALPTSTVPVTLDQVLAAADAQAPVAVRVPLRAVTPPGTAAPAAPQAAAGAPAASRSAARPTTLAATGSAAAVLGGLAAGLLAAGLGSVAVARRASRRVSQGA